MKRESSQAEKKEYSFFGIGFGRFFFCFMSVFSLLLILKNSQVAIDYMTRGMKLCVTTVIPSLFPFMVASELLVKSGAAGYASRLLRLPARKLFGINEEGISAFLLGILCGFPIGTRASVELYNMGKISKEELERLICFSNNPSSAFIISAVGASLFGSKAAGKALYLITILSAVSVGIFLNISKKLFGKSKEEKRKAVVSLSRSEKLGAFTFTEAISSSAMGMLNVSAFVIFFSAFIGTLGSFADALGISDFGRAVLFSFFELTGGVSAVSALRPLHMALIMAAMAVGWSGLSVHFQIMSICDGLKISFRRYFLSKLFQSILSALYMWLWLYLFGHRIELGASSVIALNVATEVCDSPRIFISLSFVLVAVFVIKKTMKQKKDTI